MHSVHALLIILQNLLCMFESVTYFCLQRMFLQGLLNRAADFNTSNVNVAIAVQLKMTITSELSTALTGMQFLFSYFNVFPTETRNFVASQVDAVEVHATVSENIYLHIPLLCR